VPDITTLLPRPEKATLVWKKANGSAGGLPIVKDPSKVPVPPRPSKTEKVPSENTPAEKFSEVKPAA
jgi:hypothetical protein